MQDENLMQRAISLAQSAELEGNLPIGGELVVLALFTLMKRTTGFA